MGYCNDFVKKKALKGVLFLEDVDHLEKTKLGVNAFDNAILVPGDREYGGGLYAPCLIGGSNFNGRQEMEYRGECRCLDDGEVLYLGMLFSTWGHCLTDFLSFVWPMLSNSETIASFDRNRIRLAYVTSMPNQRMPENYFMMLDALGIKRSQIIHVTKATRFKRVYFPDPSFSFKFIDGSKVRTYTKEYLAVVDEIRSFYLRECKSNCTARRIYISRSKWRNGIVDFGEQKVEEAFKKHYGCTIVHPESMSLGELICVLNAAEEVVVTEGSTAHNLVFSPIGAKVVILRKADYANGYQPAINQARSLAVTYVDANSTFAYIDKNEPWFGPFFLRVNSELARFLGIRSEFPIGVFLKYVYRAACGRARRVLSKVKKAVYKR